MSETQREAEVDAAVREGLRRFRPTMVKQHAKFAKRHATEARFAGAILHRIESGRAQYVALFDHIQQTWREAHP